MKNILSFISIFHSRHWWAIEKIYNYFSIQFNFNSINHFSIYFQAQLTTYISSPIIGRNPVPSVAKLQHRGTLPPTHFLSTPGRAQAFSQRGLLRQRWQCQEREVHGGPVSPGRLVALLLLLLSGTVDNTSRVPSEQPLPLRRKACQGQRKSSTGHDPCIEMSVWLQDRGWAPSGKSQTRNPMVRLPTWFQGRMASTCLRIGNASLSGSPADRYTCLPITWNNLGKQWPRWDSSIMVPGLNLSFTHLHKIQNSFCYFNKNSLIWPDVLCWGHRVNRVIPNKDLSLSHPYDQLIFSGASFGSRAHLHG